MNSLTACRQVLIRIHNEDDTMSYKFAVFGNPIKQSLSPPIHQHFARQLNLEISYDRILSEESRFAADVERFFIKGGDGCNVTAPFKEIAYSLCDKLTESAARAQAVNTLYKNDAGELCGHNTDGIGLLTDLTDNLGVNLADANIIVLGAGGATRGILQPLIEQKPASLTIINRTLSKATTLAEEFADLFSISTAASEDIPSDIAKPDLLLNATSASLEAKLPISDTSIITSNTCCYDLSYAAEPTSFMVLCKKAGSTSNHDGRGMLVEQAALAFTTWTSNTVDTRELIKGFENLTTA